MAEVRRLLEHGSTPHGTSLEDYVAFNWTAPPNLLGARHAARRDRLTIQWLSQALSDGGAALDVGCSYGHHVFRLNAVMGKQAELELIGVDLDDVAVRQAQAFAATVSGYSNCCFLVADLAAGLPFEPRTFDAVNMADVIEHIQDPPAAFRELARVMRPGATLVVATPLRDGLFKRLAGTTNRYTRGRLFRSYYGGKNAELDESGQPVMETFAGLPHVSEMTLPELFASAEQAGFVAKCVVPMQVMSGSAWFDEHLPVLAGILMLEWLHEKLRRPSWAHSVMLRFELAEELDRR